MVKYKHWLYKVFQRVHTIKLLTILWGALALKDSMIFDLLWISIINRRCLAWWQSFDLYWSLCSLIFFLFHSFYFLIFWWIIISLRYLLTEFQTIIFSFSQFSWWFMCIFISIRVWRHRTLLEVSLTSNTWGWWLCLEMNRLLNMWIGHRLSCCLSDG